MANPFLVLGGIAVGIVTAAFGVLQVPGWVASAQDASAINDLSMISDAQATSASVEGEYSEVLGYLESGQLGVAFDVDDERVKHFLANDKGWCSVVQSDSGLFFGSSSQKTEAVGSSTLDEAITSACAGISEYPANAIVFTIDTTLAGCITPALSMSGAAATINWGDGTPEQAVSGVAGPTHTYAAPGEYEIIVTGTVDVFTWPVNGSAPCITGVPHWGPGTETTSAGGMFFGATNLTNVAAPPASVTQMFSMFYGATSFNGDISRWDVSNVETIFSMFNGASSFNRDISGWDVSKAAVNGFANTFANATSFNQPVGEWDVTGAKSFGSMFLGATSFNQDLRSWDMSSADDISNMFDGATSFNQPIDGWDVSNVTRFSATFKDATSFNQPLNSWNTGNASTFDWMFGGATAFNQPLSTWDTASATTMFGMFSGASSFNRDIGSWDTSNVEHMTVMFENATAFLQDLSGWTINANNSTGSHNFAPGSALDSNRSFFPNFR